MVKYFNEARPILPKDAQLAFTTSHPGEPIKRRCGRQYSKAYSNDRFYITWDHLTSTIQKDVDITSLFVRRSVFLAFWGWDDKQDIGQQGGGGQGVDEENERMPDAGEEDKNAGGSSHPDGDATPDPAQDHPMRDRSVAVRPRPARRGKTKVRTIQVNRQKRKTKNKKIRGNKTPPNRSSALTTFISNPQDVEVDTSSQPKLIGDNLTITIFLRQDGEWVNARECPRGSIIEAILELQRQDPERALLSYSKDSRGIVLKDCPTYKDDFIYLYTSTDISNFLVEEEL
ncbi:hypothetical protein F5Y16DRAFT_208650 [Xylariaceae sp. FL0255]|nr:hypothetical protein F5Y16DRAFT_208650 [Xylariaceae sp. FL0255]